MATTYQAPGVYVEEVPSGSAPIEGVGTSIAAFVGFAERGPMGKPMRVTNWTQYQALYGGLLKNAYMPLSVYGFFANGGGNCWIVRVGGDAVMTPAAASLTGRAAAAIDSLKVTAKLPGGEGNSITVEVTDEPVSGEGGADADGPRFRMRVSALGKPAEVFENLTLKKGDPRQAVDVINHAETGSKYIQLEDLQPRGVALAERTPAAQRYELSAGSEAMKAVVPADFQGDVAARAGIEGLEAIDDVTMVLAPDIMRAYQDGLLTMEGVIAVQKGMLAHCTRMGNRVAILDTPPNLTPQDVDDWKMKTANLVSDGGYGALYYPWIKVDDPASGKPIFMPPSGHIAGLWSRVDTHTGVHKAPANEELFGVLNLETQLTQTELGTLNVHSINCIRAFAGRGIRVWGGRTLAEAASEWRYINVRRLINYIKSSIDAGTQWVVFEPNDFATWAKVTRTVGSFLTRTWGQGALFGLTPQDAFYVKCDTETNTPELIEAGMLVCEVGIAPVKPAEFVIFHIRQMTPGIEE